ncbi:hypothetical protein FS749_014261 [Ceratobasidium sp. UAMH 11750]|nr:hypothetical protein FS749_014261 [Ceratobasidium sp. UAMH 11750]
MSNPMPSMPNVDMSALLAQLTPQIMQMNEPGWCPPWRPPCHRGYGFGACACTASRSGYRPNPGAGADPDSGPNSDLNSKPRWRGWRHSANNQVQIRPAA